MKQWWLNLGARERQAISIGGIIFALFLAYEIIWAPMSGVNDSLREEISRNQKLLHWMQDADQRIHAMESLSQKSTSGKTSAGLLSILQKEINQSPFANNLTQLNQGENNTVRLTLQKVNFDDLIKWLIQLWQKQGLTVAQMNATPNGALGIVDVNLVIM